MSKLGKTPIKLEDKVQIDIKEELVKVTGPKGEIEVPSIENTKVELDDGFIKVTSVLEDEPNSRAYWGLARSLINNAVIGVTEGYEIELELVGVGYRVEKVGNDLRIVVGYSHPVDVKAPEGIVFDVEGNTEIKVSGIDKQLVGQVAANIRAIRKPEPYKGKGIKYKDEIVKRKQGKAAKTAA